MIVNYEFLNSEPIENIVTCLNFKIDKVVFFGYREVIDAQKEPTVRFLKRYCGVKEVVFHPVSDQDLQAVLSVIKAEIEAELNLDAKLFFDITGGEELALVAFGILSREYNTPMHIYNIRKNRLIELDDGSSSNICDAAEPQHVPFGLDRYIELRGATINTDLCTVDISELTDTVLKEADAVWQIMKRYAEDWNSFSHFLRGSMVLEADRLVHQSTASIRRTLSGSSGNFHTEEQLYRILDALSKSGMILNLNKTKEQCSFILKNDLVKDWLWVGGRVLELHVFSREKNRSDECRIGVHLDWDGIIHPKGPASDVTNEVDVISFRGLVPKFISCKSGKMGPNQCLHALYELDTIAGRFGGKYAEKVLVTANPLGSVYLERAEEMGIKVIEMPE